MKICHHWQAVLGVLSLAFLGGCQKVSEDRLLGEDRFANNLIMWSVAGEYREVVYRAESGKNKPIPDVYLKFEDGGLVRMPEITEEFLLQRSDVTSHDSMPEGKQLHRGPCFDFIFKDKQIVSIYIRPVASIALGPSPNGPFVTLPCDEKRFIEVFGEPTNRHAVKPTAP